MLEIGLTNNSNNASPDLVSTLQYKLHQRFLCCQPCANWQKLDLLYFDNYQILINYLYYKYFIYTAVSECKFPTNLVTEDFI